jgi:large repetitive protein
MRLKRPQVAATNRVGTSGAARRRLGAGAVRLLSVTAIAAATCSLWAGAASAATSHVTKHSTTTSVSVSPKTAYVFQAVKLSATVKGAGKTPSGKVTFKTGSLKLCTAKLSHGKGSCRVGLGPAGTYKVRGYYSGDSTHKTSTSGAVKLKEVRAATTTKITGMVPNPVEDGGTAVITVHVSVPAGAPAATGSVSLAPTNVVAPVDPGYLCTATLVDGTGSCSVTPPTPSYGLIDYVATYVGTIAAAGSVSATDVLPVQETTTTTVTPATAAAGSVTLSADVVGAGEADVSPPFGSGSVTFYIGSTVIPGCGAVSPTDPSEGENNVATCTHTFAAGTYTINAVYSGDDVNLTSTGTETLTVS